MLRDWVIEASTYTYYSVDSNVWCDGNKNEPVDTLQYGWK